MDFLRGLALRVLHLFRRADAEQRASEEFRFHIEMETETHIRAGVSPAEARRRALVAFGGVEQHRLDLRDVRRLILLEDFWRDVRYALRGVRRDAASAAFAVLIVGIGIGASVTVFSLVNALLLGSLPLEEPEQLVWIANGNDGDLSARTVQGGHLETLRAGSRTLTDVAGYHAFYGAGDHHLLTDGDPQRVTAVGVTSGFFRLLGVTPLMGRSFTDAGSAALQDELVLLTHDAWTRLFAGDPDAVGRSLTLNGASVHVAGVLPAHFDFGDLFAPGTRVDLFTLFPITPATDRIGNTLVLVGRLAPGVTAQAAEREAAVLAARAAAANPDRNAFDPQVSMLREHVSGSFRVAMLVLAAAVVLMMLIVCANLSNLLLTRAAGREPEFALRAWLGAGRGRLVRQLLTESMLLSCAGGALGVLLAVAGTRILADGAALTLPLLNEVRVDRTVLAFATAVAVGTGLLFGLAPALRMAGPSSGATPADAGGRVSAGRRQQQVRRALVMTEVALACALLVGSGLLVRSFVSVLRVDPGFRSKGAVAMRIDPNRNFASAEQQTLWYEEALERVTVAPGIGAAGLTDVLPFSFNRAWSVGAADRTYGKGEKPEAFVRVISEGYFAAMGIPLRSGRDLTFRDNAGERPVILLNETLARALWPDADPLGRMVKIGGSPDREVIGIVADTRHQSLEQPAGPEMYVPLRQSGDYAAMHVVARGTIPPAQITAAIRTALRPLDATLPLADARVIQDLVDRSISPRRMVVLLLAGFAAFALLLASLGIYAVVALGVRQRRHEIGIRVALGASPPLVQRRILGETLSLVMPGIALGLVASWVFARLLRTLLYGVPFTDPVTFGAAAVVLVGVAALAGWLPARRAARRPVVEALRAD